MNFAQRLMLVIAIFIFCVGCDQSTKSIAKSVLSGSESSSYFHDTVRLHLVYNQGAFLSLGSSLPANWRKGLFTVGVAIMLLGTLAFAFWSKPGHVCDVSAAALVFSGGFSNLLDRTAYGGAVADFMNVGIGPVRTGIFNVADLAIVAGFFLLLGAAWRRR